MLLPRVLTAAAGIPLLLFLVHRGGLAWDVFVAAVAALSLYEYGLLLSLGGRPTQRVGLVLYGSGLALCAALGGPLSAAVAATVGGMTLREMFSRPPSLDRVALSLFGAVFLGWMLGHLALIRDIRPDGEKLTWMLFLAVWVMDTAAYAAGRAWGRHPLSALSPKKTWEGAAAGFVAALATALAFRKAFLAESLGAGEAAALGFLIAVCGQLSDLAESMIKRAVGAKDSGSLLPGHGGVMDRFDSFIMSAPAVYYALVLR